MIGDAIDVDEIKLGSGFVKLMEEKKDDEDGSTVPKASLSSKQTILKMFAEVENTRFN